MTVSDPSSARLAALLSSASVEISSRGHQIAELPDHFVAGTDVTITFLPGDNYRHNVETATALRRAGYNPVPHIAAREMASREALDDFLARAQGEAAVSRILLIAGDVAAAKGPFKSTRDVCASGLIEAHGIASVSVAGHPEGHPFLEMPDALKGLGPALLGTRQLPERVADLAVLLAPTLLAALVVTQTLGGSDRLEVDARLVGVGVAGLALALRAPLIVVVVLAAVATTVTRALV